MSGKIITRIREREERKHRRATLANEANMWVSIHHAKPPPFWLAVGLPAALIMALVIGGFGYIIWSKP